MSSKSYSSLLSKPNNLQYSCACCYFSTTQQTLKVFSLHCCSCFVQDFKNIPLFFCAIFANLSWFKMANGDVDKVPCCYRFFAFFTGIIDLIQVALNVAVIFLLLCQPDIYLPDNQGNPEIVEYKWLFKFIKYPVSGDGKTQDWVISIAIAFEQLVLLSFSLWRMGQALGRNNSWEKWEQITRLWQAVEVLLLFFEIVVICLIFWNVYLDTNQYPLTIYFRIATVFILFFIRRGMRKVCSSCCGRPATTV